MIAFDLAYPFSPGSLLVGIEFEIGFERFQALFLSFPAITLFRLFTGEFWFAKDAVIDWFSEGIIAYE
jgi:hypothetical protein